MNHEALIALALERTADRIREAELARLVLAATPRRPFLPFAWPRLAPARPSVTPCATC